MNYLSFKDIKKMDLGLSEREIRNLLKAGQEIMKNKKIYIPKINRLMITNDVLIELIGGNENERNSKDDGDHKQPM